MGTAALLFEDDNDGNSIDSDGGENISIYEFGDFYSERYWDFSGCVKVSLSGSDFSNYK